MGNGYLETPDFARKKDFCHFCEIVLASDPGPWLSPPVATKKASTIETTTTMKTLTKPAAKKSPKKEAAPSITHDELLAARDRLFELKEEQTKARDEELRIREYLARKLHDGVEGSKTVSIEGIKVTITRNLSRTIGVDEAEKLSKEHSDIALACLRWKAEVRVGEYKKHTEILDEYIVTKAGPSSVEFK
jgi:hypothetical protein